MFKGSTVHACASTFSWSRFREEGFDAEARRIDVAPSFPRQMWQRSSPHCWQKWQSGQGCFPGAASERFAGSKTSFSPATGTKHPSSFRSLLPMTPPGVNLQFDHRPKHLAASHFLQSGRKRTLAQRVGPCPVRFEKTASRTVRASLLHRNQIGSPRGRLRRIALRNLPECVPRVNTCPGPRVLRSIRRIPGLRLKLEPSPLKQSIGTHLSRNN